MSYIDRNLLPGEKILFRTKKHFIIFFVPAVLLLLTCFLNTNTVIPAFMNNTLYVTTQKIPGLVNYHHPAALFMLLLTLYNTIQQLLIYASSDYAITNTRVIMREGVFDRYVCDMRLAAVSNVTVDQNLLAQALNYGTVTIHGFGGMGDCFIQIAHPNALQNAVHTQLDNRVT